jgi:hypothetical protein
MHNDCAAITQRLRNDCATSALQLRYNCATIAQRLRDDCTRHREEGVAREILMCLYLFIVNNHFYFICHLLTLTTTLTLRSVEVLLVRRSGDSFSRKSFLERYNLDVSYLYLFIVAIVSFPFSLHPLISISLFTKTSSRCCWSAIRARVTHSFANCSRSAPAL